MATTKLTTDLDNIQGLSDTPNETEGLTADQLKAKFDKAGGDIKTYLNSTLTAELDSNFLLKATKGAGTDINTGTDDTKYITSKAITDSSLPAKDGWSLVVGSWTYASSNTINVPSGAETIYSAGDKFRYKQGGEYKYGYIVKVVDTLLTVTGCETYTVANAEISEIYYSHQSSPLGFPEYFNCYTGVTSVLTGFTFNTGNSVQLLYDKGVCIMNFSISITGTKDLSTPTVVMTLPAYLRPTKNVMLQCICTDGTFVYSYLRTNGELMVKAADNAIAGELLYNCTYRIL